MDQATTQQPISDDQELAKVLAGVSNEADAVATEPVAAAPVVTPASDPAPAEDTPPVIQPAASTSGDSSLDAVKLEAIQELRPLVDKLNVAPEEKFDTYLLLLRSTDDKTLIAPAHEAAKAITDETRRAQALLDIIKEIDFLSQNNAAA